MIKGFGCLGLAHRKYKLNSIINAVPTHWAIVAFDHPFGDVAPKIKKLINVGYKTFEIQCWWDDNHKIAPINHTEKKAKKWGKIARENPNCTFYLSHSCEYNEPDQQKVMERVRIVQKHAPNCIVVNSVWRGATIPGVITERHGDVNVGPGQIVNTDGTNHYDIDAQRWYDQNQDALMIVVWGYRQNLREIPDPGQPVPKPNQRTAAPSIEYNRSLVRLLSPKDTVNTDIKKPEFYKSHAEDDQEQNPSTPDDPRENKPCFASKQKADKAIILAANGKEIGVFKRFGSPISGCWRYYAGTPGGIRMYGYEIAEKAVKVSGSEIVSIKVGKKIYKNINPAFREGYFR